MIPHLFASADGESFGLDILGYELAIAKRTAAMTG